MPEKKLTLKQRKWLEIYIETGNATEAARQAYNCATDESARAVGYENLTKLHIPVNEILDKQGLTDPLLTLKIKEGLEAVKDGLAATKDGQPDHATRHKYLVTALKLRGLLRDRLSLEDPEGKPLGPVILPIKEGDEQKFTAGADSDDN